MLVSGQLLPRSFTSGESAQCTNRTGGRVNPEPVRTLWRRKNLLPLLGIKAQFLDFPASSLVTVLAKLCSVKLKHSLYRPGHALSVPGGCGSHISRQHMKVVMLSAIHTSWLYPQETSLVIVSVRGWIDLRATAHPEGLCQWKIPVTLLGIEPMTFRLVAQCLNQLHLHVPQNYIMYVNKIWILVVALKRAI
jgi:hypothetical protein